MESDEAFAGHLPTNDVQLIAEGRFKLGCLKMCVDRNPSIFFANMLL